jgi:hypothetical protein
MIDAKQATKLAMQAAADMLSQAVAMKLRELAFP